VKIASEFKYYISPAFRYFQSSRSSFLSTSSKFFKSGTFLDIRHPATHSYKNQALLLIIYLTK